MDDRPSAPTKCDVCGVTDFLNKHNLYSLQDRVFQARHFQCCLRVGCPPEADGTQSCAVTMQQRGDS